jgi:subtilase family serine protease
MQPSVSPAPVASARRALPPWLVPATIVVVVALIAGIIYAIAANRHAAGKVPVHAGTALTTVIGLVPPLEKQAEDLGEAPPNQPMNITIALPLRNQAQLRTLLAGIDNPKSPNYHKYLTPAQFVAQFGVDPTRLTTIATVLGSLGLSINNIQVSAARGTVSFTTTVSTVETLLHTHIHNFSLHNKTYYGPTSDPQVPDALAGLVTYIGGLNDFGVPVAHLQRLTHAPRAGFNGYEPAQLQKAYGADTLIGQGADGNGQSIAFMELADYNAADIQAYQQQNNLSGGTFETVQVDGGGQLADGAGEVELDMEVAFAIAPKIHEYVYEAPHANSNSELDIYSQIVNDDKAKIVSTSWGQCENQEGSAYIGQLDQIFQQGVAEGINFFAAAGDAGAYDCNDTNLAVDSPASDQNVTGVGGTALTLNNDNSYSGETAWSCADCQGRGPNGAGGGGGISQAWQLPSYQQGLNPKEANGNTQNRFVPDVSADADPNTGYDIICTASQDPNCQGANNGHLILGGTSAAAPLWAAGMALVNQYLAQHNANPVGGGANAALYAVAQQAPGAFHDVTRGDNLHYHALPGYDLATGLGSPDFGALAQALAAQNGGNQPAQQPQDLLANGGFETGVNPWVESSKGGYQLVSTAQPYQGAYSAYLCGYSDCQDVIAQSFQVPQTVSKLTLSYYWALGTQKADSSCDDTFQVTIDSVNSDGSLGSPLVQVQKACNTDATGDYAIFSADLTTALQGQAGQTLAVVFVMQTNNSASLSAAIVDNVALLAQ